MAEQNNELLMKNHESRPTGTTPFPEVNAVNFNNMVEVVVVVVTMAEEEIVIIFVVVILIIQISKEPLEMMIIKEKLHKVKIQKMMSINASDAG